MHNIRLKTSILPPWRLPHLYLAISLGSFRWYSSIVLNFIDTFPSHSSSMSIIYDIVSMMQLNSCIVFWFPLLGDCDSSYATIIFLPWIYSISESCSSIISLHIDTLSVLQIVRAIFLWSLYIINNWASNIGQYSFKFLKMLSSYFSVDMYLFYDRLVFYYVKSLVISHCKLDYLMSSVWL